MVATQLAQVALEAPPSWHPHLHAALVAAGVPAVAPLAEFLRRDEAAERDLAVAALQRMTIEDFASVKAVIALLQAGDARVRRGAVRVLSGRTFWERRAVGALAQALGDPEATVRLEAIGALSAVGAWSDQVTNALPALRAFAGAASGEERDAAVAALVRLEAIQR
jgi:HEAT repeat protein